LVVPSMGVGQDDGSEALGRAVEASRGGFIKGSAGGLLFGVASVAVLGRYGEGPIICRVTPIANPASARICKTKTSVEGCLCGRSVFPCEPAAHTMMTSPNPGERLLFRRARSLPPQSAARGCRRQQRGGPRARGHVERGDSLHEGAPDGSLRDSRLLRPPHRGPQGPAKPDFDAALHECPIDRADGRHRRHHRPRRRIIDPRPPLMHFFATHESPPMH